VYVVTRLELMVKLNLTKITILMMMMRRLPEDKKGRRLAGMGGMIIVTFYERMRSAWQPCIQICPSIQL